MLRPVECFRLCETAGPRGTVLRHMIRLPPRHDLGRVCTPPVATTTTVVCLYMSSSIVKCSGIYVCVDEWVALVWVFNHGEIRNSEWTGPCVCACGTCISCCTWSCIRIARLQGRQWRCVCDETCGINSHLSVITSQQGVGAFVNLNQNQFEV